MDKNTEIKKILFRGALFLRKFVQPKSTNEDKRRREFILNILLISSIFIYFISFLFSLYNKIFISDYNGLNPVIILIITIPFLFIYLLSKFKSPIISSYLFIIIFYIPTVYATYRWGADVPVVLLFSVLVIIMSSVLISTKFSFLFSALVIFISITLSKLEVAQIINADRVWKNGELLKMHDVIIYSIIFFIITIICWLSNREIEKSLHRARFSEKELKKEKDGLEIKVEERTKELHKAQVEKISQIYKLAEFGRLSSGLFHDLIDPLTALSINIENIKSDTNNNGEFKQVEKDIERTIVVSKKMRMLINSIKKQINNQGTKSKFSINQEIKDAIEILEYKTRKNKIEIELIANDYIDTYGVSIKLNQVIINLINNSIDAYQESTNKYDKKPIEITLIRKNDSAIITVSDKGPGIDEKTINNIFEPFFTTKDNNDNCDNGIGIGLSESKRIIEKNFKGTIKAENKNGAFFTIKFPIIKQKDE